MKYQKKLSLFIYVLCFSIFSGNFHSIAAQIDGTVGTSDGVTLHYKTFGKGSPVLILPGNPGITADYLLPVASEIGKTHQAILLHPRGTGDSKMDKMDTSNVGLKFAISDIETLRKHLKLDKMTILGHSWGGGFAIAYAGQYPTRVRSLILVSSVGYDTGYEKYWNDNLASRMWATDLEAMAVWSSPEKMQADQKKAIFEMMKLAALPFFFDRKKTSALTDKITPDSFNLQFAGIMTADLSQNYNVKAAMSKFKKPVLIVQGRQDPIDASTAYQTKETITQAKIEFIEKCGHFPWIEQPEKFFTIVNGFLGNVK